MSGVQNVGMALLLVGGILTTVSVCMPTWSKNDPKDTTRDSIKTVCLSFIFRCFVKRLYLI